MVIGDPQVGFNAVLSYTPGPSLEVRDASTNALVFSGPPQVWNGGTTHAQSGDRGWWFDFSTVTALGSYVIVDPSTGAESARFDVSPSVYDNVMYHALRMYYYQRANEAKALPYAEPKWTDAAAFLNPGQDADAAAVYDQSNAALRRDLSGGWWDAGDQNKYVTFTESTLHDLLSAYQEHPQAFTLSSNIPESSNALPDLLDEVKVELDWVLKMTNADGSTILKMGNSGFTDNLNVPPSTNTDPRYYSVTCTSASFVAAGVLANAALVYRNQPGYATYADILADRANACYAFAKTRLDANTLETNCDNGEIRAGDADRSVREQTESAIVAAVYLGDYQNSTAYDAFLADSIPSTRPFTDFTYFSEQSYLNDALLRYVARPGGDAGIKATLVSRLNRTINAQPWYGWNASNLYRAPLGDDNDYYGFGSNLTHARFGFWNLQLDGLGYSRTDGDDLGRRGREMLHYLHGVNPLGLVMLSNMYGRGAERSVDEIYHGWFFHDTPGKRAHESEWASSGLPDRRTELLLRRAAGRRPDAHPTQRPARPKELPRRQRHLSGGRLGQCDLRN